MYKFYNILEKSQNKYSKKMNKDIYYSELSAQPFFRMVKEYFEIYPNSSNSEAYEMFLQLFNQSNQELTLVPTIKSDTLRLNICTYLVNNPKELKIAYDKIHREEEKGKCIEIAPQLVYSSNKLASSRIAILQALSAIRKVQNSFSNEQVETFKFYAKAPRKIQNKYKDMLDYETKKQLDNIKDYFAGDEYNILYTFLKKKLPDFQRELKEDYIQSLMFLERKFKDFGLLEKYNKDQNKILEKLNLTELEYPLNEENNPNGSLTVESLFSREVLEEMSINQLSMLNAFWVNRYTKELKSMNQSFFIVSSLNLWSLIKNSITDQKTGRISIDIDEDELENIFQKMYFLHETSEIMIEKFNKNESESQNEDVIVVTEDGKIKKAIKVDTTDFIKELDLDIGSEYLEYFERLNPDLSHDFMNDFDTYRVIDNSIHNAYKLKDMNMIAILSNLYKSNFSKNWGIILEDGKSIEESRKILLGIDVEGFNMPVRLHIDKNLVKDFLKANQNTSIIPVYEGKDDFIYQGKVITTPILIPISKAQKIGLKQVEKRLTIDSPVRNLIEHLKFLSNTEEYPEH